MDFYILVFILCCAVSLFTYRFYSDRMNNKMPSEDPSVQESENIGKTEYKRKILWPNTLLIIYLHAISIYGFYLALTSANLKTSIFAYIYGNIGGLGITAGYHRLWSHRSYKAKLPLRAFLCMCASIAGQNDIYEWCRNHRRHHKFVETDADPHNIKRGFFFAHVGWMMVRQHPEVARKGKTVLLEDVWADPIVPFHKRFYIPMVIFFGFYLPTMLPVWMWGEGAWNAFFVAGMLRYGLSLNATFLVNSAAHSFGNQPFDTSNEARENPLVSVLSNGEGWHNYHHAYPWDYSASELGYTFNFTKMFIDAMAAVGQAYDLKKATPEMIERGKVRTGDGTRFLNEVR